jgi:HEAT repeat protein
MSVAATLEIKAQSASNGNLTYLFETNMEPFDQRPSINWLELEQVGSAANIDLSGAFRQLLSADVAIQQEADILLGELLLRHPDTIPAVVKSLIAILHDPNAASSYVTSLRLLLHLVEQSPLIAGTSPPVAELNLSVVAQEFRQSAPRYLTLLSGTDPNIRALAAAALAAVSNRQYASALAKQLETENDVDATLSILRALAALQDRESLPAVAKKLTAGDSVIQIRAAATFCLLVTSDYFTALQMLIKTAIAESPSSYLAWSTLLECGTDTLERAVQLWVRPLASKSGDELIRYTHKLIRIVFPSQGGDAAPLKREDLSAPQMYLLRTLLSVEAVWEMPTDSFQPSIYNDLLDSGLPATQEALARFVYPVGQDESAYPQNP